VRITACPQCEEVNFSWREEGNKYRELAHFRCTSCNERWIGVYSLCAEQGERSKAADTPKAKRP